LELEEALSWPYAASAYPEKVHDWVRELLGFTVEKTVQFTIDTGVPSVAVTASAHGSAAGFPATPEYVPPVWLNRVPACRHKEAERNKTASLEGRIGLLYAAPVQ
jgi:hypothetical protein